jgi:hypothetical protein
MDQDGGVGTAQPKPNRYFEYISAISIEIADQDIVTRVPDCIIPTDGISLKLAG